MEHNKKEGRYRERKRARWSTSRMRGYIGRERERDRHIKKEGRYRERKRARWSTTRRRGDIGRERERDGAQQGGEI